MRHSFSFSSMDKLIASEPVLTYIVGVTVEYLLRYLSVIGRPACNKSASNLNQRATKHNRQRPQITQITQIEQSQHAIECRSSYPAMHVGRAMHREHRPLVTQSSTLYAHVLAVVPIQDGPSERYYAMIDREKARESRHSHTNTTIPPHLQNPLLSRGLIEAMRACVSNQTTRDRDERREACSK